MKETGRNDPCPCGSGKKYKQCCQQREIPVASGHATAAATPAALQAALEHHRAGRLPQAQAIYRQILEAEPNHADALHYLGAIAFHEGKLQEAAELIGRAIRIRPSRTMHYNLGNALKALGDLGGAAESYRRALALKPDYTEAYNSLGNVLYEQGKPGEAVKNFRKALTLKPSHTVHYNLGNALKALGDLGGAAESYRRALALKPGYAEAHVNLGNVLESQGRLDEAVGHYRNALLSRPDLAGAHLNLGNALKELGRLDEAIACYRRALALRPDFSEAYSNLLYLHAFTRDIPPEQERDLAANWENIVLTESERAAAHERFSGCSDRPPRAGRKLKVGVASAELGQHAVAEFLEPFLEQVDRSRFHITLYPTVTRTEPRAARFRELADEYKSLVGVPDKEAADLIRSDRIDILIDTTGHMNGCRLGVFARRAAPVQCHYIGYHGTTGLAEMDWYIADGVLLPPAYDAHFREGIWRLPRIRMSYKGNTSLPGSNWRPNPDGSILFGSFNNLTKVREESLGLWARVMNALPQSKLLLKDIKAADPLVRQRILAELFRYGIGGERVEFASWAPDWNSHMALYDRLDIALDTIPLNSETTAFDALWMGVPLVALEGNWVGGRQASTLLKALGKPEWVARNEGEYVAIVTALARDVEGRKSLRASQRALMANSPLCDVKGLARLLEAAFEEMFDRWWENKRLPATFIE